MNEVRVTLILNQFRQMSVNHVGRLLGRVYRVDVRGQLPGTGAGLSLIVEAKLCREEAGVVVIVAMVMLHIIHDVHALSTSSNCS
jgi:hypothetical protein